MLDVHPARHAATSWGEFLVHIATIVVGLCIAVGLEQTVEYVHHRHQVAQLTERMRTEARHNVDVLQSDLDRLMEQARYLDQLHDALVAGKTVAGGVGVQGVPPPGVSPTITAPSRGTWQAAQAAGLLALLPPEQARLYARADFNAADAQAWEGPMRVSLGDLASEYERTGYDHSSSAVSVISQSERKDLIYKLESLKNVLFIMSGDIADAKGADEAILAGVHSLDQMYPYQEAALVKVYRSDLRPSSGGNFYGGQLNTKSGAHFYNGAPQGPSGHAAPTTARGCCE